MCVVQHSKLIFCNFFIVSKLFSINSPKLGREVAICEVEFALCSTNLLGKKCVVYG